MCIYTCSHTDTHLKMKDVVVFQPAATSNFKTSLILEYHVSRPWHNSLYFFLSIPAERAANTSRHTVTRWRLKRASAPSQKAVHMKQYRAKRSNA